MISNENINDALKNLSDEERQMAIEILKQMASGGQSDILEDLKYGDFAEIPVDIETFLDDDKYLGRGIWTVDEYTGQKKCTLFPYWRETLKKIFPDNITTAYNTLILTGSIGLGKTLVAVLCQLYLMYRMLCLKDPYAYYGMMPSDKITFAMLNITLDAAQGVGWDKMQQLIQGSDWFMTHGALNASRTNPQWQPPKGIELIFGSNNRHIVGRALFCLDGNTEILTTTGVHKIADLVNKDIKVVSIDANGKTVISNECTVKPTIKTNEEINIELEDGTIIKCTPNHKLMLKNGTYKEAKFLTEKDELADYDVNDDLILDNTVKTTYEQFIQNIIETRGQWADEVRYSPLGCERHHIIPKSSGGEPKVLDWKPHQNIIWLYPKEHYIAHKLLYLENPHNYGLYAAWRGTTKNCTISDEDYEELKKYSHNFPQEIIDKINNAGEFRYKSRKEYQRNPNYKPKKIKDPIAYSKQKSDQCKGEGNPMFGHGERVSGAKNGHASIRYYYDDKVFECKNDLLDYLNEHGIPITASAIRALVHGTGTRRLYNMYKNVFDKLAWEVKDED